MTCGTKQGLLDHTEEACLAVGASTPPPPPHTNSLLSALSQTGESVGGLQRGMRPRGNEACFLSAGADEQGASPRRSENTAKKGIKLLQSAASLTSCQTIPVKALFWWRPEQQSFGECKEKMYTERRYTAGCRRDYNGGF